MRSVLDRKISSMKRSATCLAAAAVLTALSAAPAHAQLSLIEEIGEAASSLWSRVTNVIYGAGDAVTPPTPIETLRSIKGEGKGEFWSMLEDAGYDLKEIDTEIGLIPGIEAKYLLKRELSDADREALEFRIERYAENAPGLIGMLERAIIVALLDASELGEYRIEEVKIQFLPLPAASFTLAPAESPLGEEHDRIFRAVKGQSRDIRRVDESHRAVPGAASTGKPQ